MYKDKSGETCETELTLLSFTTYSFMMVNLKYVHYVLDDNDKDLTHYNAWHLRAVISESKT